MAARDALGSREGLLVANPIPVEQQWDPAEHDAVLAAAFAAAEDAGVHGKAVTPFLLGFIVEASEGRSLEVNLDLARNNVRVAGGDRDRLVGAELGSRERRPDRRRRGRHQRRPRHAARRDPARHRHPVHHPAAPRRLGGEHGRLARLPGRAGGLRRRGRHRRCRLPRAALPRPWRDARACRSNQGFRPARS